jgi:hypothetical protein
MNLKPGVPDKMCMLYWRGSHFFTVILDIQRKHITYESFASSNESVIRALLSAEVHGGYFETARPRKVFSVSVISTRLIIRFLLSTTHSRSRMWMVGFVISFLDDAGQSKHRVVFTKKYRYSTKYVNIITPVETCKVW